MFERINCYLINSLGRLMYKNEYKKFIKIKDIEKQQAKKLFDILTKNKSCTYGSKYDFDKIKSTDEYQHLVPLTTYEDYIPFIERIKNGEKNILTKEDVLILEPTGGSTSATKLIPYTKSLKVEFQKGLKPWVYDLYSQNRGLNWGKSYWSITPATTQKKYTKGGLPIGFEEDSEYLGDLGKRLMQYIFAVPAKIAQEKNIDHFYYKTALCLLKCKNLTFISIWNPTLLILLIDYIKKNSERLLPEITNKRRSEIKKCLHDETYYKLWPHLKLISCWGDAHAHGYAEKLKVFFPHAYIQPKGLLATEGFISFPFTNEEGARLSLNSHFFEFISTSDNKIYLAHELTKSEEYEVVITTSGGLYRYKLNDLIKVTDFQGIYPLIEFMGKRDKVCDLFGEKLHENFIKNTMDSLGVCNDFYMFAPEKDRYVLYIQINKIPQNIDVALRKNFHYDYCRKLGQLKELAIFRLMGDPLTEYINECVKRGQKLGDIKPSVLHLQSGWDKVFKGKYIMKND
ncbi:MAG: GH3 auxin-responsive promoter family protein [Clostridia bacterium]|nr:GH3 auxin-responsive promoter family protein [Clostridia bacterium]